MERLRKTIQNFRISGIPAEIRTEDLQTTILEGYSQTNLFGNVGGTGDKCIHVLIANQDTIDSFGD